MCNLSPSVILSGTGQSYYSISFEACKIVKLTEMENRILTGVHCLEADANEHCCLKEDEILPEEEGHDLSVHSYLVRLFSSAVVSWTLIHSHPILLCSLCGKVRTGGLL